MRAALFNIQKYSLSDGPGIRTTFFFKGCPLSCAWCSNPESQSPEPEVIFEGRLCVGCGRCAANCPSFAVKQRDGISIDRSLCVRCFSCAEHCPAGALSRCGKDYSVDELLKIALKDSSFYNRSGGGVTLSGGEPLLYADFVASFLTACREEGLNTAIETCGAARWDLIAEISPLIDSFYFDLKHIDDEKHRTGTNAGVEMILSNLKKLASIREDVIIRFPFIPGFNSYREDVAAIAEWIAENAPRRSVELVPYHRYGEKKYESLNRVNKMAGIAIPGEYEIEEALGIFSSFGVPRVRIH